MCEYVPVSVFFCFFMRATHAPDEGVILDIIPDQDGCVEVIVNGVALRTVEDVKGLLPLRDPGAHDIHLVTGLFVTDVNVGGAAPTTPVVDNEDSQLRWGRVPSVRLRAELASAALVTEPASMLNGLRPVYTLKPLGRHVHTEAPVVARPGGVVDVGVGKLLLSFLPESVCGVANVYLDDWGRRGEAVATHVEDDAGVVPAWFVHGGGNTGSPSALVQLPTLYPWRTSRRAENTLVLWLGRRPTGRVRVLGTLLRPGVADWYRAWSDKPASIPVFNGYPLDAYTCRDACFLFGHDVSLDLCAATRCTLEVNDTDQIHWCERA
jgi:hypothetical protein